jgi:predicted membrane protein
MENYSSLSKNSSGRVWSGLIILAIGIIFLLRSFGVYMPDWVVSWHTLLIFIGLFVGVRKNFNGGGWLVLVLLGTYFTLNDIANINLARYFFPLAFILVGLFLILRPRKTSLNNWKKKAVFQPDDFTGTTDQDTATSTESEQSFQSGVPDENEVIDSINIFAGTHHKIYSKTFKGGDVTALFGGCELNLTQADFSDTIMIDIVAIFGGVKLIIPASWEVKSEITAIFGGVDDKRAIVPFGEGPRKILIIKGVALFGGVDIKNY